MTKDFGPALDRELDTASPPTAITADGIIHKGRRQGANRVAYTGTASVIAVFLAAGLVFQLVGGGPGGGPDGAQASPSASGEPDPPGQVAFPLPDLPEDKEYGWIGGGGDPNDTTRGLTDQWWAALSAVEGAEVLTSGENDPMVPVTDRVDFPDIVRGVEGLFEDLNVGGSGFSKGPATGYSRPFYTMNDWPMLQFDGELGPDVLEIAYYPKGSYLPGARTQPGGSYADYRHLTEGCEDLTYNAQGRAGWTTGFECAESDGPGGERVLSMEITTNNPSRTSEHRYNRVVVYYPDGNAVVITDHAPSWQERDDGHNATLSGTSPGLGTDELAALAFRIPPGVIA
ncbi:hypothetical protein [Phytomonospora endophytica]|uniref:Uncharacterized protein n=1 Tax=Phytomonospora endophytica TaxID=714109 RepID=A0A841FN92_9ACTN|nr:hypothetical protein [Phytomonospora endophytica]MBB6036363.1 hypothetical protein [Phytomonospora endophytica]GIG67269.1 hypothetical protein Pen01_35640 [Phytomonospora endophytica]